MSGFSVFDYLNTELYIDTLRLFLIPELCDIVITYFHSFQIKELSYIKEQLNTWNHYFNDVDEKDLSYKKSFIEELHEIYYYDIAADVRYNNSKGDGCVLCGKLKNRNYFFRYNEFSRQYNFSSWSPAYHVNEQNLHYLEESSFYELITTLNQQHIPLITKVCSIILGIDYEVEYIQNPSIT